MDILSVVFSFRFFELQYNECQTNNKASVVAICETSSPRVQMNAYELVFECCFAYRHTISITGSNDSGVVLISKQHRFLLAFACD